MKGILGIVAAAGSVVALGAGTAVVMGSSHGNGAVAQVAAVHSTAVSQSSLGALPTLPAVSAPPSLPALRALPALRGHSTHPADGIMFGGIPQTTCDAIQLGFGAAQDGLQLNHHASGEKGNLPGIVNGFQSLSSQLAHCGKL